MHGFYDVIQLAPDLATIPGFADGYPTPCECSMNTGAGIHFPRWELAFDPAAEENAWWLFALPRDFVATEPVKVRIHWLSEAETEGDVVWGVSVLGREEGEAFDAALGTEVTKTDTTQDAAGELTVTEITLTPAKHSLAAKDAVVLQLARKAADGSDDMAGDAKVVMAEIEFACNPHVNW